MTHSGRRVAFRAVAAGVTLIAVAWLWIAICPIEERTQPDHFDLGTVAEGSTIEFSAGFLWGKRNLSERVFERVLEWMPNSWHPSLRPFHPGNRKKPVVQVDLATFKPAITIPPFLQIVKTTPEQGRPRFGGEPMMVVDFKLVTSRTGDFSGTVVVTHSRRRSSLPVSVRIVPTEGNLPRILVARTLCCSDSTEDGSSFQMVTTILGLSGSVVDCRETLPKELDGYGTIILADRELSGLDDEEVTRVRRAIDGGARVVLPCNYFFRGTVKNANRVMAGFGLAVADLDITARITVTNIVADDLTRGVTMLQFFRPSPITVTDETKAKLLAVDASGTNGYAAVARTPGGGEIVVLASSLWWNWVREFTNSNNARFLENVLKP